MNGYDHWNYQLSSSQGSQVKLLDVVGAVVTGDLVQGLEPNVVQGVPGLPLDRWEVVGLPWVAPGRRWRRSRRRQGV